MPFEFIIFDLDDTLYPRDSGLMQEIGRRIQTWLCNHLGLSQEEATAARRDYLRRFGTTMGGLIAEHHIDVHDYLAFVHDIPVKEYLEPNPALAATLASIPLRKAVYTNALSEHGWRVLRALRVADHFEQVIGIEEVGLRNKFHTDAYEKTLALLDAQGPECIMVEDSARNLRPAKALGMTTVLVNAEGWVHPSRVHHPNSPAKPVAQAPDPIVDFAVAGVLEVAKVVRHLVERNPRDL